MRFQRVPGQMAGADGWGRWLVRFQRVPAQMADEVPECSGADSQKPSKIFQAVGDST